jgi:SIR2-like domain
MRFLANGPSIPDELLLARDQGRVVFFCGAGVSRARAGLPDFFGLAEAVARSLGVQANDPALKVLSEARAIGARAGVDGLISADRVFGLLERDFLVRDIVAAVSAALKPQNAIDLSAHQILLDLATTKEGLVRLVTTNFDRLFDQCREGLPTFQPPRLPDPSRPSEFNGVVYLHGKSTAGYDGAEGDGYVLSSSEFGRAYLSDGWATTFFRQILEKYFVVFVGYAAEDPPVQYLLEALNKTSGKLEGVYAFQSGTASHANSRWRHKGVEAIPYDTSDDHAALWNTLAAWSERARNPEAWIKSVVETAKGGPERLLPHERGQVTHLVGTIEGLRYFSEIENPPPASWLCVFDPYRRYAKPGKHGDYGETGQYVDPFDFYGLDSDIVPEKVGPEDHSTRREMPKGVWDAFAISKLDRLNSRDDNYSSIRGHFSSNLPRLPARLAQLGIWIQKVAHQPEAVWWAVRQSSLHPSIRGHIAWELDHAEPKPPEFIRTAWRYLFDYWDERREEEDRDWYRLAAEINSVGWNATTVRRFSTFSRPRLKVEENYWRGPIPGESASLIHLDKLLRRDVEYSDLPANINIPDEWLWPLIIQLRKNLECALELENEIGGYGLSNISPISPGDEPNIDEHSRIHGLSAWVLYFTKLFDRLIGLDQAAAKSEFMKWPSDDSTIFARLRIWGAGKEALLSGDEFRAVIAAIPNEAFWYSRHSRDLLLTLARRWNGLDIETRSVIEERILLGPDRWHDESDDDFISRGAWATANLLNWMNENECRLILDLAAVTSELSKKAPDWKPEYAQNAAHSFEARGGWVRTETEHSVLLEVPLASTLSTALEHAGRRGLELVEFDPFAGLSSEHPVRAFSAMRQAAKRGDYPEWAWRTFLNSERRKTDKPKFSALIAEQIVRGSDDAVSGFLRAAADWCQKSAKVLASDYNELFSKLVERLTFVLSKEPKDSRSGVVRGNKDPDWTMEAINSPTGDLAEALFDDPRKNGLNAGDGLPLGWLTLVESLLNLPGDMRRHALVIFAHNLSWFFAVDPKWTKSRLLAILDAKTPDDEAAVWSGFLWGAKARGQEFFMILKPHMLVLAKSSKLEKRGHANVLTGLLLSAWSLIDEKNGERWVTNDELREVLLNSSDDFRSHALWQVDSWSKADEGDDVSKWSLLLATFLRDVWPRQIAAKSAIVAARLCDLAFSNEKNFPEITEIVLPLLSKTDGGHLMLPNLRRSKDNIVDLHPRLTLILLFAVLPDNVASWPYGIEGTLARIGEADISLKNDERLLELQRRWDAR